MRLFFAISLDEALRASAASVAENLQARLAERRSGRAVKWVERENLHVTMRFLGEVEEARARQLIDRTRQPLAHPAFDLAIGGAGAFPQSGPPRVVWIGIRTGAEQAANVFDLVEQRIGPLGFEREERAYTPHVTMGRIREIDRTRGRDLREWLAGAPALLGSQRVERVSLYRSHLSSAGPRYEIVTEVPLAEQASQA